jgi:hypothetical protein
MKQAMLAMLAMLATLAPTLDLQVVLPPALKMFHPACNAIVVVAFVVVALRERCTNNLVLHRTVFFRRK